MVATVLVDGVEVQLDLGDLLDQLADSGVELFLLCWIHGPLLTRKGPAFFPRSAHDLAEFEIPLGSNASFTARRYGSRCSRSR